MKLSNNLKGETGQYIVLKNPSRFVKIFYVY